MYAYNDPKRVAYGSDESGPQACAPICGGTVKPRCVSLCMFRSCKGELHDAGGGMLEHVFTMLLSD